MGYHRNPSNLVHILRLALAALAGLNLILIFVGISVSYRYISIGMFISAVLLAVSCLNSFLGNLKWNRYIRTFFGLALAALATYGVVGVVPNVKFGEDPETHRVCQHYGDEGKIAPCVVMTVNLMMTCLMILVLVTELAATCWARTQLKKERMREAEIAKLEDQLASQRNRDYLMDVRSQEQEGVSGF